MEQTSVLLKALRRAALGAVFAVAATIALTARGEAQMVAVVVNGEPITSYDIEQRTKLTQVATRKTPSRQEVLQELIDEKLKVQLLRRYNITDIDKDVENAFNNMARRTRITPKQFAEQLERAGVMPDTLKSRIRADLVWSQVIRGRYQSSFQFSEQDIMARLGDRQQEAAQTVGYDYTLRPILFVVPRGSPPAAFEARRKEAEAFRASFQSCEQGIPVARAMRYVAVRAPVTKSSAELAPALRDILEKTDIGRLTAPELTQQGIEVYALCAKKQSSSENAPLKKEIRDQMFKEQFEKHAARYLKELRSQAMIEYR